MIPTRSPVLGIRRIVAGTLVLVCLGVNALGILYVSREHKLIEKTMSTMTKENGRLWAKLCGQAMANGDTASLHDLVDVIRGNSHVRRVVVSDMRGVVLAATEPEIIGDTLLEEDAEHAGSDVRFRELHPVPGGFFHESGHNFEFRFPVEGNGKEMGSLLIEINTAWGNRQAKTLATTGLTILLVITVAIIVLAGALDWRLRRAIKHLIEATQAIGRGQLDKHVRVGTGDELDALGDSVNMMADALRESEARVQHWHGELERTITRRTRELEESQALLAQREKVAALGLMAAGVAHEIGNPLAAVSAILQRIDGEVPPKLREKCNTMRQQIERISKIVDEMRLFSRPSSKGDRQVNINETLRMSVQICRYDPRAKRVKIDSRLDPDVPAVRGNVDRWQQIFLNLIFNAYDAMPKGGTLTIISRVADGRVEMVFRDTGKGMPVEQLRNLFHPFYSTKQPGRGFGLGLSVCQGIVNSYGGRIDVESDLGRGTEFRVSVPAQRSSAATEAAVMRDQDATKTMNAAGSDAFNPKTGRT